MNHNRLTADLVIVNKLGIHARAAARFVKLAFQYKSTIYLIKDGQESDGKSIMSLLMLAAEKGSIVTLMVSGEDQQEAFDSLKQLIESGFGE
ncbi:MAG: HPr family phosphocarrier protein [Deltaproteobacteria bacterium]|nr:HPr family phosphocarrier protein [Deltaproteobacteria bacterium]